MLQHRLDRGRNATRLKEAFTADDLERFDGIEGQQGIDRTALIERSQKASDDAGHMKEREPRIPADLLQGQPFTLCEGFQALCIDHRVVHEAIMGEESALWKARGAGGVHEDGWIRRADRGLPLAQCCIAQLSASSNHLAQECGSPAFLLHQANWRHPQ